MNLYINKRIMSAGWTLLLILACKGEIMAQLVPMASQYYENEYLGNPAFAGLKKDVRVNLSTRNQWKSLPGSPSTHSLTADYYLEGVAGGRVGTGLNIYSDKAGLIRRTRVVGSYSYQLPLNGDDQTLRFGVSLGVMNEKLDFDAMIGDPNDLSADRFNERKSYLDGDFGIAYIQNRLTIQGALPNLKKLMKKDLNATVDGSTFFMAFSYKIGRELELICIEPKFCFRGARDINNLWDVGTNIKFSNNAIYLMGMYHSSRSSTIGLGLNYQEKVLIQGYYTSQLAAQRLDTGGSFEVNLQVPIVVKGKKRGSLF
ncbi:MAG: PorP/SprF family type IX secretion system membrane protein [Arcticibacter sp.]